MLQTAQAEQICIRKILNTSMQPALRHVLENRMAEYSAIERQAYSIGSSRGWDLPDTPAARYLLQGISAHTVLRYRMSESEIASGTILRNTKAMIQTTKHRNQFTNVDIQIDALSQKLLDCEAATIHQMQLFL